ncbi:NfeD family protein [Cellulomonas sp. KRMCY2]|uniref:NfeD family protein n=1 Tax=Cellulomonas sp. KRMCY2 TaxID=1304865 RepID=UPI00045E7A1F|nr:NfeD family protein [Cellulomonas sp. KRMCY2]
MAWIWWVGAALLLAVVEMLSVDLVLIMFAGGALLGALLAALGLPVWVQIIGFAVASGLLLFTLRPWLLRHLRTRVPLVETNAAAHVGRTAVVVAQVTERAGRVKLAGEVWTARTRDDEVIDVGAEVQVVRIDGATAVVTAAHAQEHPDAAHRNSPDPHGRTSEETAL